MTQGHRLALRELMVGLMRNDETWGDVKNLKISRAQSFTGWKK